MNPFKSRYNALGMAYRALTPTEQDLKDEEKAQRASQIANCDCWKKCFFPLLSDLHDETLQRVKEGTMHIDALKIFDDIVHLVDGQIQIGAKAMERMANRRLKASELKDRLNQARESA